MRIQRLLLIVALALGFGYAWLSGALMRGEAESPQAPRAAAPAGRAQEAGRSASQTRADGLAVATFAAGCFWCTEADFDKVAGVVATISGYIGGTVANPTYKQVTSGATGHAEAVEILFNPSVVSYDALLDHFWRNVDPFVAHRQFCDVGNQYRPEIFVHGDAQREAAEASKARVQKTFGKPIVVAITDAGPFYRAEEYHQDYYKKNSAQYRFYRFGCGRDARLSEIWQKPT